MDLVSEVKVDRLDVVESRWQQVNAWNSQSPNSPSPTSSCSCPDNILSNRSVENRRGRPRAEALTNLMIVGSTSPSAIKCDFCKRVFPREKSLQAHLRTHTGERPYACDYPGCLRAFTQGGQLRTHQRLHTGEKPFACGVPNCGARFKHANRHCPEHPQQPLIRCSSDSTTDSSVILLNSLSPTTSHSYEVLQWLEKYHREKERSPSLLRPNEKSKTRFFETTPKREDQTIPNDPLTNDNFKTPDKSNDKENHTLNSTPRRFIREQPKKRWLRAAFQDASLRVDNDKNIDLAKPINWGNEDVKTTTPLKFQQRPTVLVCAGDRPWPTKQILSSPTKSPPRQKLTNQNEWMGAIALMELATSRNLQEDKLELI